MGWNNSIFGMLLVKLAYALEAFLILPAIIHNQASKPMGRPGFTIRPTGPYSIGT
ncbi:hypothetical protein [Paenibacillus ihumii]|uniref:hypothetical protein n=1 Tax=Paenibacillus ihumii TaxID=687436 RepID=UPI00292A4839|nr:hypothetical protein [Paenibacillus ihumii]